MLEVQNLKITSNPSQSAALGVGECRWIEAKPRRMDWYGPLKLRLKKDSGVPSQLHCMMLHIVRSLYENHSHPEANNDEGLLANMDLDDLVETLVPIVRCGMEHPNSLVKQQRATRSIEREQNQPGHGLCRRWCAAARALCSEKT